MLSFAQKRATTTATRTLLPRRAISVTPARRVMLGEGDKALFDEKVVKGNALTIVDFHAEWCPPCKMLDPVLEKVMKDDKDADYLKIDTDNEAELAAKYKVSSLPTVIAFKHGKEFSRFVGFVNEEAVRNFLENAKS